MAEGLIIYNKENKIIGANKQTEKILGLSLERMLGRTSLEPELKFIREDGTHFPVDEYPPMITLRTGKHVRIIMGSYKDDGSLFWILVKEFNDVLDFSKIEAGKMDILKSTTVIGT